MYVPIVAVVCGLDLYLFVLFQKQTKEIKEKQTSVMAELAKVEPAVQDAKMGKFSKACTLTKLPKYRCDKYSAKTGLRDIASRKWTVPN